MRKPWAVTEDNDGEGDRLETQGLRTRFLSDLGQYS